METRHGLGDQADIKMIAEARGLTLLEVVERSYRDSGQYAELRNWAEAAGIEKRATRGTRVTR